MWQTIYKGLFLVKLKKRINFSQIQFIDLVWYVRQMFRGAGGWGAPCCCDNKLKIKEKA